MPREWDHIAKYVSESRHGGGVVLEDAKKLIEILDEAGVDDLATLIETLHGAVDVAQKAGKQVIGDCFRELEVLAVVAISSKSEKPRGPIGTDPALQ